MSPDESLLSEPSVASITEAVRAAGRQSLPWYRRLSHSDAADKGAGDGTDGGFDPVTEADRTVEVAIRQWLGRHHPGHRIVGEEYGITDGAGAGSDYEWLIDPVDGTRAFVTGQPLWGTLVGLRHRGEPVAGWMYLPVLDESYVGVWTATTGDGGPGPRRMAHLVEHRSESSPTTGLTVSATTSVSESVMLCTHPEMFAPGEEAAAFATVAERVKMVRFGGDCVNYGLLAMGLADLVIENQLAPYDIVPLIPIITAAGGVVTNRQGGPATDGGFVVAAATPELHAATLELLNRSTGSELREI